MKLHLSLKDIYFRLIKSGVKKEEYREVTPYWCARLLGGGHGQKWWESLFLEHAIWEWDGTVFPANLIEKYGVRDYDEVEFSLGYPKREDRERRANYGIKGITIGFGNPDWGAKPGKEYFVIKLGEEL